MSLIGNLVLIVSIFLNVLAYAIIGWHMRNTEHRLDRIEQWIRVHHPLIPNHATAKEVQERGYYL